MGLRINPIWYPHLDDEALFNCFCIRDYYRQWGLDYFPSWTCLFYLLTTTKIYNNKHRVKCPTGRNILATSTYKVKDLQNLYFIGLLKVKIIQQLIQFENIFSIILAYLLTIF